MLSTENPWVLCTAKEYWNARELQHILEYAEWRNFLKVVDKAKIACENSGISVEEHFVDVNKMVENGKENLNYPRIPDSSSIRLSTRRNMVVAIFAITTQHDAIDGKHIKIIL